MHWFVCPVAFLCCISEGEVETTAPKAKATPEFFKVETTPSVAEAS